MTRLRTESLPAPLPRVTGLAWAAHAAAAPDPTGMLLE
eukprot:CAMPEP_0202917610 /NCGR_PEP_ID=MMETSP1392-20130828/71395_1 /ASSEMBLY_ACC=CAM_ASM_000868 /TAXON_ID=225041 /ORGANISM="Chlamydomonas chlamydogama, Strain SAG 11-48b" /LENGTH=37 /DNA_ID= /DNA_START= /DNA_END= /DNA_ORIENTATION=